MSSDFSVRLKAARELRKLTQAELGRLASLPSTTISHFESGNRKPSFDNLRRITKVLAVGTDYLMGVIDEPDASAAAARIARHLTNASEDEIAMLETFAKSLAARILRVMDSLRRRTIEANAEELLCEADMMSLPVKPIHIAEYLEIQVTAKPPSIKGASGWLIRSGDEYGIIYATHIDSIGFQHFSIAHEIGHFRLDKHPEHVFRNGVEHASHAGFTAADDIEREADYFAACLLMPKQLCKPLINSRQDGMAAVIHLATKCETSLTAAALRYAEIGGLPVGVVQCFAGKVEFCASYPLQRHAGWARALARNSKVPTDSATRRLADDPDAILHAKEDSDSVEAYDWFPGADRNAGLIEEAIGLGRFGRTLTVLTLDLETIEDEDEENDRWEEPRFR